MNNVKKHERDYVKDLRINRNICYLAQKYRKAHEWIPRLPSEAPGVTPDEVLKKLRERLAELRKARKQLKEFIISERIERAEREMDLRQPQHVGALPRDISKGALGDITSGAARIDGIAGASGFKEYILSKPRKSDTEELHLFLPINYTGTSPTDFTGATGLQFLSKIEVQWDLLWDAFDGCDFAGILQYSLPEAPWDGAVQWSVNQVFQVPEVSCDADWGDFAIFSTAGQCPSGDDFPSDASFGEAFGIGQLRPIIGINGEGFSGGPYNVTERFQHGFPVSKGQKPRIYVGFLVSNWAQDGSVSVDPGMAYHFCPSGASGLSYTFVRI